MTSRQGDGVREILAMICLLVMGPMFFLVMPLYVGALAESGVDVRGVGVLTSSELVGSAIASVSALFWIRRAAWRPCARAAALVLLVSNVASVLVSSSESGLLMVRPVAGVAAGALVAIAVAALGDTQKVDRNFGLGIVGQLAVSGVLFMLLPGLVEQVGVNAVFGLFACCAVLALLAAGLIPARSREASGSPAATGRNWLPLWPLFAGMLFFVGVTGVWAFIERIGDSHGLSAGIIGAALGLSTIAGIAGALLASWLGDRVNRFWPMLVALTGLLISLVAMNQQLSATSYLACLLLFQVCWNLWVPYQMSVVAIADTAGRLVVLLPLFQSLGVALGPLLASRLLVDESYPAVLAMGAAFLLVSLLLFMPVTLWRNSARLPVSGMCEGQEA